MKRMQNQNHGFSLIELLTVSAIISILTGMIGIAAHSARMRAYSTLARMEAQQIATAFKSYWVTKGRWPSGYDKGYNGPLTKEMLFASDLMGSQNGTPYLEISKDTFSEGEADASYLDPWGHPYTIKVDPPTEIGGQGKKDTAQVFQVVVGFVNTERYYYQE